MLGWDEAALLVGTAALAVGGAYAFSVWMHHQGAKWWAPLVVFVVLAAGLCVSYFALALEMSEAMKLDHDKCAQYVWLDEDWKCVPWEEAG